MASDGKSKTFMLDDVKFISGSEKMKLRNSSRTSISMSPLQAAILRVL